MFQHSICSTISENPISQEKKTLICTFRNMNGSARGSLLVNEHGFWATKPESETLRYVCQQEAGFFCLDGMVQHDIW